MDEKHLEPEQPEGGEHTPAQEANFTNQMTAPTQIAGGSSSSCYPIGQLLYPHQHNHQLQQQALQRKLQNFWKSQFEEIENTTKFNHALPLARIKKVMKGDEGVSMVAAEAPVLFSKACEMFIMELTMRSWVNAEENKRRTLKKSDIASAISGTDLYDFLVDVVPKGETMELEVHVEIPPRRGNVAEVVQNVPIVQNVPPPHPYYYVPSPAQQYFAAGGPSHGVIPPSMVMARPPFNHPIYGQQLPYPYGLQVVYRAPKCLMMKNSPDSDDQDKKSNAGSA